MNNCPICDSDKVSPVYPEGLPERLCCRECGCQAPLIAWKQPRKVAQDAQRYDTVRRAVVLFKEADQNAVADALETIIAEVMGELEAGERPPTFEEFDAIVDKLRAVVCA